MTKPSAYAEARAHLAKTSDRYCEIHELWKKGVPGVTATHVLAARREALDAVRSLEAILKIGAC